MNRTDTSYYSRPDYTFQSQKVGCPNQHWVGEARWSRPYDCRRRTCTYLGCREQWARREYHRLSRIHQERPFTHMVRIITPDGIDAVGASAVVRRVFYLARRYCDYNGFHLAYKVYPERHGRSRLHWHGALRVDDISVIDKLRECWRSETGLSGQRFSVCLPRSKAWLGYVVKYGRQYKLYPVWQSGAQLIVQSKRLF